MREIIYSGAEFERKICEPYWREYFDNPVKLDRSIGTLKKNLSPSEQCKVDLILERLRRLLNGENITFLPEEAEYIADMEKRFNSSISIGFENEKFYQWDKYKLSENQFDASVFYYQCGIKFIENTEKIKSGNIIDAGAYVGDSSIVLADYTDFNVYAFEAFYDNFRKIEETCRINKRKNIVPINYAIGSDNDKDLTFYIRKYGEVGHGLLKREGCEYIDEIKVKTITIDNYVKKNNLKVSLIKSDIEGAERALIAGAKETICGQKPTLL